MSISTAQFDRWKPMQQTTWAFAVLREYDLELMKSWTAHYTSKAYTFKTLKESGASWEDHLHRHFNNDFPRIASCSNLKEWAESKNTLSNWINLSVVLSLASNLETYLTSVMRLSLDSDPGVLFGMPHSIDGSVLLKRGEKRHAGLEDLIVSATKGEWSSRLHTLESLFGSAISPLRAIHTELDRIRTIRNRFGHAFGRDIEESRETATLEILPMQKIKNEQIVKLRDQVFDALTKVDESLLANHIGDFEIIVFWHRRQADIRSGVLGERAKSFKKLVGQSGIKFRGKVYCKGLIKYWDSL